MNIRYWQWPCWDKESVYFNSITAVGESSYVKSRIYYDQFQNALYSYDDNTYRTMNKKSSFKSYYDDYTVGGSVEGGTTLIPWNDLKISFHYKRDYHKEHNEGNPIQHFQDEIMSIGVEDTIDFSKNLYTILGVSYDRQATIEAEDLTSNNELIDFPTDTTDAVNAQGGIFYKVLEKGLLHASISRKSRFPSIKDKYSYKMGKAIPNPYLNPEEAMIYELGYQHLLFGDFTVEGTFFFNDVTDYILEKTVPDPDNPGKTVIQNQNIGNVNLYGFELWFRGHLFKQLEAGFNFTHTKAENNSTNDEITNVPACKAFAYLLYTPIERLKFLGDIEYDSSRYSSTDGVRVAKGFALINTKVIYEVFKGFTAEFGINNLFDKDYEYDEGYPEPGRTFFGHIRYRF